MFQSFDTPSGQADTGARIDALRALMARDGLDAVLVPRADAHQGEYVADADARLRWLTGFSGSAGFAIVTADRAGVFIDGRYRVLGLLGQGGRRDEGESGQKERTKVHLVRISLLLDVSRRRYRSSSCWMMISRVSVNSVRLSSSLGASASRRSAVRPPSCPLGSPPISSVS